MNQHQEFIENRRDLIRQAAKSAEERGIVLSQMVVVLTEQKTERDTWPAGPPSGSMLPVRAGAQVACSAITVPTAKELLEDIFRVLPLPPVPGYVRVLVVCEGTAFFTHVSVEDPC